MFELSARCQQRLHGVHPDLVRVVVRAAVISPLRFVVLEGVRSIARQAELVRKGASTTMRSRHLTGHAVDIAPFLDVDGDGDSEISWHWPHYHQLAAQIKGAALQENVPLQWGGDWREFKDGPHWELPWQVYRV